MDEVTNGESRGGKLAAAGRADKGKRIVHTQDPKYFIGVGLVKEFGARKYHQRNFLKVPGMAWSRVWDSLQGHLQAWWGGEELDEESGLHHLFHAGCNLEFLATYALNEPYHVGDDRPSMIEYKGKSYLEWGAIFKEAREALDLMSEKREVVAPPDRLEEIHETGLATLDLDVVANFSDGSAIVTDNAKGFRVSANPSEYSEWDGQTSAPPPPVLELDDTMQVREDADVLSSFRGKKVYVYARKEHYPVTFSYGTTESLGAALRARKVVIFTVKQDTSATGDAFYFLGAFNIPLSVTSYGEMK